MGPRIIPEASSLPNARTDARRVFDVLNARGVAIVLAQVGYGLVLASVEGMERSYCATQRKPGHALGLFGTWTTHRQLHD